MKKIIVTALQIAVTVAILAWLFRDPARNHEMLDALRAAHLGWIFLAVLTVAGIEVCAVIRWHVLLKVQGVSIHWARLTALMMIGLFFNIFMPGGTGGDVAKIYYLLKETPGKQPAALLAVMMDRVVGLLAMMLCAGVVIFVRYEWLTQTEVTAHLLHGLLFLFAASILSVGGAFVVTSLGWADKLPKRLPMRDKVVELSEAYHQYGRAWSSSLAAFLISIPVHIFSFIVPFCVAKAFLEASEKVSFLDCLAVMPIVNTLSAIPVSIGGTGVREGLFVKLFGDLCGLSESTATVISLTCFMVLVLWGMLGGIIYVLYRPSTARDEALIPAKIPVSE